MKKLLSKFLPKKQTNKKRFSQIKRYIGLNIFYFLVELFGNLNFLKNAEEIEIIEIFWFSNFFNRN